MSPVWDNCGVKVYLRLDLKHKIYLLKLFGMLQKESNLTLTQPVNYLVDVICFSIFYFYDGMKIWLCFRSYLTRNIKKSKVWQNFHCCISLNSPRGTKRVSTLKTEKQLANLLEMWGPCEHTIFFIHVLQKALTTWQWLLIRASHHSFKVGTANLLSFKSQPLWPLLNPDWHPERGLWVPVDNGKLIYFCAV